MEPIAGFAHPPAEDLPMATVTAANPSVPAFDRLADAARGRHRVARACARWLALGLLLGTLDLAFATGFGMLRDGLPPLRVAQSVAAWMLGREAALTGGAATAAFGIGLYGAVIAAVVVGYRGLVALDDGWRRHPRVGGLLYGVAAYALVFEVAVPLWSAAAPRPLPIDWRLACVTAFACLVGVPAALAARARD